MTAYASAYKGMGMEGAVAKWYASLTRKSISEFELLAQRVAGDLMPGSAVLEVAPGPGYFAIELAKLGSFQVTGLDISQTFVDIARNNAAHADVHVNFQHGNASAMPFRDNQFDYLVCRAAFKNFSQPVEALREFERVLKPGGLALLIDMRGDATPESMKQAAAGLKTGTLDRWFVYLTFRFMLVKRAYTKTEFERMIALTKLCPLEIREELIGLEILLGKSKASRTQFGPIT